MTVHPLDNHLWNALNGHLARESRAVGRVRFLSPDIAKVAAVEDTSLTNTRALASAIPLGSEMMVIAPNPLEGSKELEVLHVKPVLQMVATRLAAPGHAISPSKLEVADFPKMLALVDIARPGPLSQRAMELGDFCGIFDGDQLVALAGERLRLDGYVEVATVCIRRSDRWRIGSH